MNLKTSTLITMICATLISSPTFAENLETKFSKGRLLIERLERGSARNTDRIVRKFWRIHDQVERKQCRTIKNGGIDIKPTPIPVDEGEGLTDDKLERSRQCRIGFEIITCSTNPYTGISIITDTDTGDSVSVYHPTWWHRLFCFCCNIQGPEVSTKTDVMPTIRGWGGRGNVPIAH